MRCVAMSPDQQLIEKIPTHVPIIIWINKKSTIKHNDLESPIAISLLYELDKSSYIETNIQTIAEAFNAPVSEINSTISNLFAAGYFRQITIYHQGRASQIMFDKNDNPLYTQTELRVLQKATPIWEKK